MKTTTKATTKIQQHELAPADIGCLAAIRGSSRTRGAVVVSCGAVGRYVGTTPGGSEWVAYTDADYTAMCRTFDAKYGASL
jgi:hypothetical protein